MKTRLAISVFLLFLITGVTAQPLKRWKYADLEQYIQQSKTPLVINFWATFCKPCVEEIPYFQKVVKQYADKKVKLILVSLDFPEYFPEKIEAFAKKNGFTAEIVWVDEEDPGQLCPKIDTSWNGVLPATLFINKKTNYRKFHAQQITEADLKKELALLVK